MRITNVTAINFLGLATASITPREPLVIVAADNGAGKTSLYQAIKLALTDELPRIDLKKQRGELVRGGAARGEVGVTIADSGGATFKYHVALPAGTRSGHDKAPDALPFALDPARFARIDAGERMKLVRRVSGVSMTVEAIAASLATRGVPAPVLDELRPLLRNGFDSCADYARNQATELRGAWRAMTGETYGEVKAETWAAQPPEQVPEAPTSYDKAVADHGEASKHHQRLLVARENYVAAAERRARDTTLAGEVEALRTKVLELEPYLTAGEERPEPPTCPHCHTPLEIRDGRVLQYIAPPDEGRPRYSKRALAEYKRQHAEAKAKLDAAMAARASIATPLPENPTDDAIGKAKEAADLAADLLSTLQRQHEAYAHAVRANQGAEAATGRARATHEAVKGWVKAAEALAPSGVPTELMQAALGPMRAALRQVCSSAAVVNWPLPELTDECGIQAWGRPYPMLSESEQYRVDVLLTLALVRVAGLRFITMDRADVLSPIVRAELLDWLLDMRDAGHLEQAWVFLTLKAAISDPGDNAEAHWIENGTIQQSARWEAANA